jgi:hypothetical protein
MSLKQKNERAFRSVLQTALGNNSPITLLTSQENSLATLQTQTIVIEDLGGPEFPLRTGNYHRRVQIQILTNADKQPGATADPEDTQSTNVEAVTNAINVSNLAALLSAAQDDYHVFGVINRGAAQIEPQASERRFLVDAFIYEVVCCESDCT